MPDHVSTEAATNAALPQFLFAPPAPVRGPGSSPHVSCTPHLRPHVQFSPKQQWDPSLSARTSADLTFA
eukprot:CAMPEP_0174336890 /NCGR_PEP_ID=MMETSP0810-20121108/21878_1 /TAXON_ID=73025 ORGANISM="Eutreptiella gymnastica-like, Strain CCMP1594" /NCGR_SAMPLE_ID=MMETSP0810 /ASSEMBLY_ACC=CAM_ASM_000659 /LENGTH=68 /DNA_ID=CAMNT_0015456007 /DNA_START=250 /DNA_END=452 /DNA_ORIENTATION=-